MNLKTRAIAEKAMELGISPLEVMLDNMRFAYDKAQQLAAEVGAAGPVDPFLEKQLVSYRAMAQEAAKDAAPYMHPRLAAVELTHKHEMGAMSDDELERIAARGGGGAVEAPEGPSKLN